MSNPKLEKAIINLERALQSLNQFVTDPIITDRDRAGVIQGFEYTYECFWKTFQKLASEDGLPSQSPRLAIKAGFDLGYISDEAEGIWLNMMKDRNLTTHTYNKSLAEQMVTRIQNEYLPAFNESHKKLKAQ